MNSPWLVKSLSRRTALLASTSSAWMPPNTRKPPLNRQPGPSRRFSGSSPTWSQSPPFHLATVNIVRLVKDRKTNIREFPDALRRGAGVSLASTQNVTNLSVTTLRSWKVGQRAMEAKSGNEKLGSLLRTGAFSASYEDPNVRTGLGLTGPPIDLSDLFTFRCQQVGRDTGQLQEDIMSLYSYKKS